MDEKPAYARGREAGVSLPETLVGAAVTLVILGAVLPLIWIAGGRHGSQSDRISALDQDRVAFDEMTRLIRQAHRVEPLDALPAAQGEPVEAQGLALTTGDASRDPVVLDCGRPGARADRFMCVSTAADGSSKQLIDGITDPAPFTVDASAAFVAVALRMSPPGASRPVSLEGGVSLRAGEVG